MASTAIYASRILTPHEEILDSVIVVEDGKITQIGHRDEVRVPQDAEHFAAGDKIVIPGFVDVHIHGAGGHDVMEGTAEAIAKVASTVARRGTTSLVATTVTAPPEVTCKGLHGIARYIRSPRNTEPRFAAEVLGIHLEGPFISPARRGVHPRDAIASPSKELFDEFVAAADGLIRIITLAPELPGALELVERAVSKGIVASMGHTDATYEQASAAIAHGVTHAAHMFNAMRPFSHRDTGVIGAVLTSPAVMAELIADGHHVDSPAVEILLRAKGLETVLLVSDGTAATGMRDGTYRLGNFEVSVAGGVVRNSEGKLAGSTLSLDLALQHIVALGVPLIDAVRMATLLPARRVGLGGKKGVIAIGADADIVILHQDLRLAGVMTRGAGLSA
jgi:N-acetylglucosamine-6-phosphate deacetylase